MELGYDLDLFILAFDHRGSFQKKFFGVQGDPTAEETATIADAKRVIAEGLRAALAEGTPAVANAGLLVDEQFGADIAREAKADGIRFAMPVERSGQEEFDFEYGEAFREHIQAFDPTFVKVLVRYNPGGDGAMNARQSARLKLLSDWLHETKRLFLFELLVPATDVQLAAVEGDTGRFDRELRPELMRTAIAELQASGIEPDIWKIEGVDDRGDCEAIASQCRDAGRDGVACVVLGRGADDAAVNRWLRAARGVPGYVGFAIGRSIWWDPLKAFVDGEVPRDEAAATIGRNYRAFVNTYLNG
jgi:5-dehydro-2-deoxygluconokinase